MEIKTHKLKNHQMFERAKLYQIKDSREIEVVESHDDGSEDRVVLRYCMENENAIGYFAKEYLPDGVKKDGVKRIDITAAMIDEINKCIRWHLYDMKVSLAGADTVLTLYNQWNMGLKYLQQGILTKKAEYEMSPNLGVITRNYDRSRMERIKEEYQKNCDDIRNNRCGQTLSIRKRRPEIGKYTAVLKASQEILNGEFCAENGDTYMIDIKYLSEKTAQIYQMSLNV